MNPTIGLGRIFGVQVGINWSWLLVVALVAFSLAGGVFPDSNPGLSETTYILMAAVAVPAFFACLLAHELGHALQARRDGVPIEGITLWMLGGVARFSGRFPSADAELRIALAGPLVSLALGAAFLTFADLVPLPGPVDGVVHWLGAINLGLLIFNLLPALPLDGGRILHALLWRRQGDRAATARAAGIARGFGHALVALGVILALLGGGFGALWLAVIGWFVTVAAAQEAAAGEARAAFSGMRVSDLMVRAPVTAGASQHLRGFTGKALPDHHHAVYPVQENGQVIGLLTLRSVADAASERWDDLLVRDVMIPRDHAATCAPEDNLADAAAQLAADPLHRALVVGRDGLVVGLLSITDLERTRRRLSDTPPGPHALPTAAR